MKLGIAIKTIFKKCAPLTPSQGEPTIIALIFNYVTGLWEGAIENKKQTQLIKHKIVI